MTNREDRFEIDIQATAAQVWERLTTAEGLSSWFGTTAEIDLRIGGERIVGWGDEVQLAGVIAELEPGRRIRIVYTTAGEETGAEEWLITGGQGTVRLTLIQSMSDEGIDDWEGFFGDVNRGWQLFMASMRFGLEQANTANRDVDCLRIPAPIAPEQIWDRVEAALDGSDLVSGMEPALLIPPHSRLLVAPDRSLLLDVEGSGEGRVLYAQASTHNGPPEWRDRALELASCALREI